MNPVFYIGVGFTLFCSTALLLVFAMGVGTRAANSRVLQVTEAAGLMESTADSAMMGKLLAVLRFARERIGFSDTPKLREKFIAAGLPDSDAVDLYFAVKMLGPVAGILLGSFIPSNTLFWVMVLVIVTYMLPEFILDRKIASRRERLRRSIPDAIDLLVICVDAGLGMDQAMLRVGQELAISHPEINHEFLQINREQRAGVHRIEAWRGMAMRTQLPDLETFVNMLVQTERFGTPIARALSTFADGLRLKRRQIAEERAAKTTVKIIFPLVLFIFPCLFIVLLGPAIISIIKNLSVLTK